MELVDTVFSDDADQAPSMQDVRRWIGQAREKGAAAERARIRRELLVVLDSWGDNGTIRTRLRLRAAVDVICPEEG